METVNPTVPRHSLMAERVAIGRAAHQFLDPGPVIFPDPLARPLIGAAGERWLQDNLKWMHTNGLRLTRVLLALRARYAEDELRRAADAGTRQYVILGAGLDSFAYRRPDFSTALTIYEVDHPATQQWKRERLAEAGVEVPGNVRFVPLDFNERTLAEGLAAAGFDRTTPAFFSWLGVTYYLPVESVLDTFRFIGSQRAARQVVFDYAVDATVLPAEFRELMSRVKGYTATAGEAWQTWFVPEALLSEMHAMGFPRTLNLIVNDLLEHYVGPKRDDLSPMVALMSARG